MQVASSAHRWLLRSVLALGVVELVVGGWLVATLPRELVVVGGVPEAAIAGEMEGVRERLARWQAGAVEQGYFTTLVRERSAAPNESPREQALRFDAEVQRAVARARVGLPAASAVALTWVCAAVTAMWRPGLGSAAAVGVVLAGLVTAPVFSEPLFGQDMYDQFVAWQLVGVGLGVGLFLTAPREVGLRRRIAAAGETRVGMVVSGLLLVALGVAITVASVLVARELQVGGVAIAVGPIVFGVRIVYRGLVG